MSDATESNGGAAAPGAGSLVVRVAELLAAGPAHTLAVAREAIGLSGNEGASASAVYQLLGANPCFSVDDEGVWSLHGSPPFRRRETSATRMAILRKEIARQPFAVVDVETTGSRERAGGSVVEVAICEVLDGAVVAEYETLIDPGRRLPRPITSLTGITNEMLGGAPAFEHVVDEIGERLDGRVFVAQNVDFDWGFVSAELLAANREPPDVPRLCTAAATRSLFPSLRRRNLDALAHHFGISIAGRHRAYPDALAAARVLIRLLDEAAGRGLSDVGTLLWYLKRGHKRRRMRDPGQRSLALEDDGS